MHGQKRSEYKSRLLHPETSSKLATKAQQWNHLSHELLTRRRRLFGPSLPTGTAVVADADGDGSVTKPSPQMLLTLTEKMLSVNPDPSHLWNIRREVLLYVPTSTDASGDHTVDLCLNNSFIPTKRSSFEVQTELVLTAHCLQRNPKSYSAWYHRKWSLVYSFTHPNSESEVDGPSDESDARKGNLKNMKGVLRSELDLCAQFLQMDERNFHCWNYRRFVVSLLGSCGSTSSAPPYASNSENKDVQLLNGSWSSWLNQSKIVMGAQLSQNAGSAVGIIPVTETQEGGAAFVLKYAMPLAEQELAEIINTEWDFTTSKIQDNFSNGSAFHYRSKLLPLVLESRLSSFTNDSKGGDSNSSSSERNVAAPALAREEWENILLNAIFTEPDDQTPWWYHRFIVSWAKPLDGLDVEFETLLFEMADSLRDLLEIEKESGLADEKKDESKGAKCKWAYIGLHLVLSTLLESKSMDKEEAADVKEEAEECLAELMKIDLNRKERYQNLAAEMGNSA